MRFGFVASILFHLCIVGAIVVWGRDWSPDRDFLSEPSVPVELISEARLAEITNVPAAVEEKPDEEPIEFDVPDDPESIIQEQIVVAKAEIESTAPPPPPDPQPKEPESVESEELKAPDPEPVKKEPTPDPPKTKPVVKKEEPKEDPFDLDALDRLADEARKNPTEPLAPREAPSRTADNARNGSAGGELTATEKALFQAAMQKCWTPLDGAPNPEALVVEVNIKLNRDGTLASSPKVLNSTRIALSNNRFWKVAEQSAIRAVVECEPYDFLPSDSYDRWQNIIFDFKPPAY